MKGPIAAQVSPMSRSPGSREASRPGAAPLARLRARLTSGLAGMLLRSPRRLGSDRPVVTFCFDGATRSSYLLGAALVERAGGRAVFYIGTGDAGRRDAAGRKVMAGDIRDLHLRGHEVALHGHGAADGVGPEPEGLAFGIPRNRAALRDIHPGIAAENFAYPAPLSSLSQKAAVSRFAASGRSGAVGVNGRVFDAQWLRSVPLDGALGEQDLAAWLDRAERLRGWLLFSTREVSHAAGPGACAPATLKAALDACLARGFDLRTVTQVLERTHPAPAFAGLGVRRGKGISIFAAQETATELSPCPACDLPEAALDG